MSKRLNINGVPALAGIVGPIVVIVGNLATALFAPNYNPVSDFVSSLALTPMGWIQSLSFLVMGLLEVIFVAGLFFNIRRARGFRPGIALLAFGGFVVLLIAAFPMDQPYWGATAGTIHRAAFYGLALGFPIAILLLTPSLKTTPNWKNIFVYTLAAGILALGLIIGVFLIDTAGWFGLYEMIIVGNMIIWVEVVAVHLLRLSLSRELKPQS